MLFPIASLPIDDTLETTPQAPPHSWDNRVILMSSHALYVSKLSTRDKCIQDYDPPLFAVEFDEQDHHVLEEVAHSVASLLNTGSARQRQEILGTRELIHNSEELFRIVKAGSIFAHRPAAGKRLQLCFVPCAAGLKSFTTVLPLPDLRHAWIIKEVL